MALTPKERLFAREYIRDSNATQAALRAGCSKASAHELGSRMLKNVEVVELIDTLTAQRAARVEVKADDVVRLLLELAEVNVRDAFDEEGRMLPLHEMAPAVSRAIASVELVHIGTEEAPALLRKVKFHSKEKALELLGRHLKMFTDKLEVKVDGSFADLLKKARERAQRG